MKRVWRREFLDKPLALWGWIAALENGAELKVNEEEIAEVFWLDANEGGSHPDGMATNPHFIACLEERG